MKDRKVLVPLDDSPISHQTIRNLIELKENITLPLTLLHVLDFSRVSYRGFGQTSIEKIEENARQTARQFIAARQQQFAEAGIKVETLIREGHARETICTIADSGEYNLLVIGKQMESELRNLLFDQVANYIVHHVKCPVMIV